MTLTKNEIKFVKSLQIKKYRDSHQLFTVEGEKLVNELFNQTRYKVDTVFHTADFQITDKHKVTNTILISEKDLARISGLKTPNKVVATVKMNTKNADSVDNGELVLLLDNVKDPGNLGTIIRTAEWFGITNLIASHQTVDVYSPKTIQASMGAFYHINFSYQNLPEFIAVLKEKDFVVAGASLSGSNIYKSNFAKKTALVMGSESHGISEEILKVLDLELLIPKLGTSESLNVGIAAGIFLSEYYRQQINPQK